MRHLGQERAGLPPAQLLTLALLAAISPLATAMYLPGMPAMATDLSSSATTIQLTVTAFMAGLAAGQLLIGALSDRTGRRMPLLISALVCVLASAVCVLAPSVEVLLAARLLQGLSGAAGIVLGRAIVADLLQGSAAARAFSLLVTIGAIAPVIAPLLGGFLVEVAGWRGVFGALTGIAVVMLVGAWFLLPETLAREDRLGSGLGAAFRTTWPILARRRFLGYTLALVFSYATLTAYVSASPFVLQVGFGLAPAAYAVVFAVNALGLTTGSFANARLVGRFGARRMLSVGLGLQLTNAVVLLALAASRNLDIVALLVLLWLSLTSFGLIIGNATSLALGGLPHSIGAASAIIGAVQFGVAAVVAPLVSIGGAARPLPMAVVMSGSAVIAAVAFLLTRQSGAADASGSKVATVGRVGRPPSDSTESGTSSVA